MRSTSITELTPEILERFARARARRALLEARIPKKTSVFSTVGGFLPADFIEYARMKAAEIKKTNSQEKIDGSDFRIDEQGRAYITPEELSRRHDAEALARHGNDPEKRFDEWGFPGTRPERNFLLNHDFGPLIQSSLEVLDAGGWVYAFGEVGNGKTALAMRTAWEFLKNRPDAKATFISMNQFSLDQIPRETSERNALRRGEEVYTGKLNFHNFVILDDFDKVNFGNEHKLRSVLDLIDRLKSGRHRVFITAQIALMSKKLEALDKKSTLHGRYGGMLDIKPVLDRLRQMCLVLPEFKEKSFRKYRGGL